VTLLQASYLQRSFYHCGSDRGSYADATIGVVRVEAIDEKTLFQKVTDGNVSYSTIQLLGEKNEIG
jgi:hypothetical protein